MPDWSRCWVLENGTPTSPVAEGFKEGRPAAIDSRGRDLFLAWKTVVELVCTDCGMDERLVVTNDRPVNNPLSGIALAGRQEHRSGWGSRNVMVEVEPGWEEPKLWRLCPDCLARWDREMEAGDGLPRRVRHR